MLAWLPAALAACAGLAVGLAPARPLRALLVADELPAMERLAARLGALEGVKCSLTRPEAMGADLGGYDAVAVYIHGGLPPAAEAAFIRYAEAGGRLVLLHHSISSGKRANRDWFRFLGVTLPEEGPSRYRWIEGVTLEVVNLAPRHPIPSRGVRYPERIPFARAARPERRLPGFRLHDSEVYLNHALAGPRTPLLGLRWTDPRSGEILMQETAGWVRVAGRGHVVYLMPGHNAREFDDPTYTRIVANAVVWRPTRGE